MLLAVECRALEMMLEKWLINHLQARTRICTASGLER